jgi:protein-S-isoprenylcysteine O-methyltransferase Ste14
MTRRRDDQLNPLERVFQWTGGALFVGALAFFAYSFGIAWSRPATLSALAIPIDAVLFTAFAAHHSVFAREGVKRMLRQVVPDRLLRAVYVWVASLLLIVVCAAWQPIGGEVYHVQGWRAVAHAVVQIGGVLIVASAVRTIDALDLAGIRPHSADEALQIAGPYRWVRHPLYLGWLLATFGPAHMTGDRLFFAGIAAFYLLIAIPLEEQSLGADLGAAYASYRKRVRWRIVPYVY